jgi:PAS domain S-box-containing protein
MSKDKNTKLEILETVEVPEEFEAVFKMVQDYVNDYFDNRREDPSKANIEIQGERYILIRAASMSVDFFETVKNLYSTEGEEEARNVAWNMLFDIAHSIGKADAKNFHKKMNLKEPLEKLSAGPIHFAYSGWAFVRILPESHPNPDESFFLVYDHPFSFESHAWAQCDKQSNHPVCVMNAGYSSGWCEESFGLPLVAVEIMCKAKGDESCRFVMATPQKIESFITDYLKRAPDLARRVTTYEIPDFFQRKKLEEERTRALEELSETRDKLEVRIRERTVELERANLSLREEVFERRRTKAALADSEEKFRVIATTAADSILLVDGKGRIVYWNPSAVKLFGYNSDEISLMQLRTLLGPESDGVRGKSDGSSEISTLASSVKAQELTATRKDKTTFPVEVAASTFRFHGEKHTLCLIRDVTERKRMEAELFKSKQLESLGVLAGGLAHDFNNILTGILGNISLARKSESAGDALSRKLEEAENACLQAKLLANRLLTFSKGGAPVTEPASIEELVRETADFSLSGSKALAVYEFPDDLWPAEIDRGQISQVIYNLVQNAEQAMPKGGTIRIGAGNMVIRPGDESLQKEGAYVKISIRDEGHGIPPDILPSIFDPYFTSKPGGTGLGLTSAFSIAKNHQGTITVESPREGGATFSVFLPASPGSEPVVTQHNDILPRGHGRILVMDDSDIIIEVADAMLRRLGYEPAFAKDGTSTIEIYRESKKRRRPFDAVIMDLTIPGGVGGKEAVREVLAIDPDARVIVSSGYADNHTMSNYREYGFRGVIAKPFNLYDLGAVLQVVLSDRDPHTQ